MSDYNFQETDDLSSEKGIDYRKLRNLLKAGNWREADLETDHKMCEIANRKQERWLRDQDIDHFPETDLRTIDQLWFKYSNGCFGFSVQKRIYQALGGTRNYDSRIWEKFGAKVGWYVNHKWLYYDNFTFSLGAPLGHLPGGSGGPPAGGESDGCWWVYFAGSLFSRIDW